SAKAGAQRIDQCGLAQRRRVDGDFLGPGLEDRFRIRNGSDPAGDTERNVQHTRHAANPFTVDGSALGARRDVVEDELVSPFVPVAHGELHDVAHDAMVAKANALYDAAFVHVQAGDDASGKNGCHSCGSMRLSSRALPTTAAATPQRSSAMRSAQSRTPPEACQASPGKRCTASRYRSRSGPLSVPSRPICVH